MKFNMLPLVAGIAGMIGTATPAQATWGCWYGKCDGGSSSSTSSTSSSTSGGSSSSTGGTQVPEPEQMGIFALGIAVLGVRMVRARRRS